LNERIAKTYRNLVIRTKNFFSGHSTSIVLNFTTET